MLRMFVQYCQQLDSNCRLSIFITFHSHTNLPVNFNLLLGQQMTLFKHMVCKTKLQGITKNTALQK